MSKISVAGVRTNVQQLLEYSNETKKVRFALQSFHGGEKSNHFALAIMRKRMHGGLTLSL